MSKKKMNVAVILLMVFALVLGSLAFGCSSPQGDTLAEPQAGGEREPEKVFKWKAQSILTPGDPGHAGYERFVERVYELSNGRLEIELHPIGALVPPFETFDAVATGAIEVGMKTPMWWPGKEPVMNLLTSLPGSFTHAYQLDAWYWEHGGIDIAREAYGKHNIYFVSPVVFGVPPIGAEIVHSHVPIYSIDDYRGLKVRSGGAAARWFQGLGAAIVSLPGPEIYPALEKRVVDAAEWVSPNSNWAMGLHEAAPYVIMPGLHTNIMSSEVTVNMDAWNELPDDLKTIMEVAAKEFSMNYAQRMEALDHSYIEKMKEYGVEIIEWSPQEIARATEYSKSIWEEFAVDELSRRALDSQLEYMRIIGIVD